AFVSKIPECEVRHLEHFRRPTNPAGFGKQPIQPLDANPLRPSWSAFFAARDEIKCPAKSVRTANTHAKEQIGILSDPHLLLHWSKTNDQVRWTKISDSAKDLLVPFLILDVGGKYR